MRSLLPVLLLATWQVACAPASDDAIQTFEHDGLPREYITHVPTDLPDASPLLLMLHGGGGRVERTIGWAGFDAIADDEGFVVAYAGALEGNWNDGRVGSELAENAAGVDDVGFLSALVDDLVERHGLDADRVYVTGVSNGGIMSNRLACETDRFAAMAPVIGAMAIGLETTCAPARALPALIANGSEDTLVTVEGGDVGNNRGATRSVADTVAFWVNNAGCDDAPARESFDEVADDDTSVDIARWTRCTGDAEVHQVMIVGGGHAWPGSRDTIVDWATGAKSEEIDLTERIWTFVSRFSR